MTQHPSLRYSGRIAAFDIARGLAVLGMIAAHVGPEREGIMGWLMAVPDGRSSILFAMLAGVSLAIITGRNVPYTGVEFLQAKIRIFTRAALLLVISGVLALMNDIVALILAYYAVWFILAIPFLRWRPSRLFIAAGLSWVIGPLIAIYLPVFFQKAGMDTMGDASDFILDTMLTGTYVGVIYMGFVLAGLGIGRLDITRRSVPMTLTPIGLSLAIVGYGMAFLLSDSTEESWKYIDDGGYTGAWTDGWQTDGMGPDWYPDVTFPQVTDYLHAEPHSGTILEAIGSGGTAIAIIGILLLGGPFLGKLLYPIGAVGAMSLTAYSTHIVAVWAIPALVFPESMAPLLWHLLTTMIVCSLWKFVIGRGPLEWLLYRVSQKAARIIPEPSGNPQLSPPRL
ncbi:MAG: heparan-alpha-glucosaminide N-acetyltransferase domain-containing protein [Flaviflexus sp.]|uniref:heparan-alpha-glucosaminide N-acetyltransferase domain-containing protein n=1 Tax=Flaviflexus sp. TaxID=1969482 RepID=UPI003F8E8AC5